jgi:DnaA-homolog protein
MKQLPLLLEEAAAPSLANFHVGANAAVLAHLQAAGALAAPLYLWGEAGSGKSHLLQALAAQARQRGVQVGWFDAAQNPAQGDPGAWDWDERFGLVVLDGCEALDDAQQQAAFALLVQAQTQLVPWAAAGRWPPVDLPLRDDLRSRLAWGHVFALQALSESEARAALRIEADRRGIFLSDEVMDYLLRHFSRDMKSLTALLAQLDRYALVAKRAVTIPLLRQMLAEPDAESRSV